MTYETHIDQLINPDIATRLQADSDLHDPAYADALLAVLTDPARSNEMRWRAAVILGAIESHAAIETLIGALADPSWDVRHSAAWALGHLRDARGFDPLYAVVTSAVKDEQIPYVAAIGLTQIDRERGMTALQAAAQHPADEVMSIARSALTGLRFR